jgi:hypothetical protein
MPDNDPILQSLGRMEGKLDAALNKLDGHDDDIDELRRGQAATNERIAVVSEQVNARISKEAEKANAAIASIGEKTNTTTTTLRLVWTAIGFLFVAVATVAAVIQAFH